MQEAVTKTIPKKQKFKKAKWLSEEALQIPEEQWTEVCNIVQEVVIKTIPKKKKCKMVKWRTEEVLQVVEKRREAKGKGEKERYPHLNAEFQRIARRDKKAFSVINAKK